MDWEIWPLPARNAINTKARTWLLIKKVQILSYPYFIPGKIIGMSTLESKWGRYMEKLKLG